MAARFPRGRHPKPGERNVPYSATWPPVGRPRHDAAHHRYRAGL